MVSDRPPAASPFQLPTCRPPAAFTVGLGLIAGAVDGCTFLGLFGLYVAQVTGSFVFSGTRLVVGGHVELVQFLAIPVFFLGGVVATMTATIAHVRGGRVLACVLILELALLIGFVGLVLHGMPLAQADDALAPTLLGIAAMGVQSASVRLLLGQTPSTNVMTTNTTQIAIDLTQTVMAVFRTGANPVERQHVAAIHRRLAAGLRILAAFFAGAVGGGLVFLQAGLFALVVPVAALALAIAWCLARERSWRVA